MVNHVFFLMIQECIYVLYLEWYFCDCERHPHSYNYGTLLLFLADNLAAHQLGGYKVGIGFALRKCRVCMATSESMRTEVYI